jgi:hypothetical protein
MRAFVHSLMLENFMSLSTFKLILTTIFLYSLTACSSGLDRSDMKNNRYKESLETKILPDGSKVFNFSIAVQNKPLDEQDEIMPEHVGKQKKTKGQGKKGTGQAENNKSLNKKNNERNQVLEEYFQQRVSSLNILKMFCREGYFTLEKYSDSREVQLKAECKESASVEDYNKFTKVK